MLPVLQYKHHVSEQREAIKSVTVYIGIKSTYNLPHSENSAFVSTLSATLYQPLTHLLTHNMLIKVLGDDKVLHRMY